MKVIISISVDVEVAEMLNNNIEKRHISKLLNDFLIELLNTHKPELKEYFDYCKAKTTLQKEVQALELRKNKLLQQDEKKKRDFEAMSIDERVEYKIKHNMPMLTSEECEAFSRLGGFNR